MIKFENVTKKYGDHTVFKDINLEIVENEVVVIIGPSGGGKSTLLRMINSLEKPTTGKVIFEGVDMNSKETNLEQVRQKIGMVFQQFNLFNNLNVIDNIMLAPVNLGLQTKEEAYENALRLLDKVGLKDKELAYPKNLSGGQKQRVAIARSLAMNPEVILFDEPTSALDPEMVKEVLEVMKSIAHEITMVIVTHEMNFAKEVGTRLLFLDQQTILEDTSPKNFFENPKHERSIEFLSKLI